MGNIVRKLFEHTMQVKIVQYVRTFYPEVLILSIPNGAGTTAKNRLALYAEGSVSYTHLTLPTTSRV